MSPISNVHVGDHVEIILSSNHKISSGIVFDIFPDSEKDAIIVLLNNGDEGRVIRVINSEELIKERIMREDQYTENKENFSQDIMRTKSIPQAVQSFLNSDGGHLYIGVRDTGTLEERLVGLNYDFEQIKGHEDMRDDELCDELERSIMSTLDKYLTSVTDIGSLVKCRFVRIKNVQIAEIHIFKSAKPWFYCNLSKNNRLQKFELCISMKKVGGRILDDFYIRRGGSKKLLSTHEEFYKYIVDHFKT